MEFTYKLTENEYLFASKIAVKRPGRPWSRILSYGYLAVIFIIVWCAFLAGMFLEQENLVGINTADIQRVHAAQGMVPASVIPALCIFGLAWFLLGLRPLRLVDRKIRLEHFRNDPGCQAETTVNVTPESIAFRSATGFSESIWGCYSAWGERNGILILVTRAGVRKILKITGLSDSEKGELRELLATALPKR